MTAGILLFRIASCVVCRMEFHPAHHTASYTE